MTDDDEDEAGFLDGMIVKYLAGAVIVACVGLLAYLNRDRLVDRPAVETAGLNPEFVKCRDVRVGQVEKMLADGVIGQDKLAAFKERAIATCAGQFPPEK
ncbi:MAG: hypothetical protein ACR2OM_14845 [Aestuariivirgaceae bacterium]